MNIKSSSFLPFIISLAGALGMLIGYRLHEDVNFDVRNTTTKDNYSLAINEALAHIAEKYYGTIDTDLFVEASLDAMTQKLDSYSHYWNSNNHILYHQYINGSFNGRGFELLQYEGTAVISKVLSKSPAADAGLKRGDRILSIDSIDISKISFDSLYYIIKDPQTLHLTIWRPAIDSTFKTILNKTLINVPQFIVKNIDQSEILYIKIEKFSENLFSQIMDELNQKMLHSTKPLDMIIDLRDNPGGIVEETIKLLNQLIREKDVLLLKTVNNKGKVQNYKSNGRTFIDCDRIVVLINENSASASEIFAGVLQDLDLAVIIGTHSFGKGLIQENYELSNGGSLSITVGEYLLPSGRPISNHVDSSAHFYSLRNKRLLKSTKGVQPDMMMEYPCDPILVHEIEDKFMTYLLSQNFMQFSLKDHGLFESWIETFLDDQFELSEASCKNFVKYELQMFLFNLMVEEESSIPVSLLDSLMKEAKGIIE